MAESLLAHLYTRIRGSQEDVATLSLQYILSNAQVLNDGFNRIISQKLQVEYDDTIKYVCQVTGDNKERPDMAGYNRDNKEKILCEMKFYAGLTDNQPLGYIDRLKKKNGQGLIFICPKVRITRLWTEVKEICKSDERKIEELSNYCIKVDGINMAIVSWGEILDVLNEIACESARESKSDLKQLIGYCDQLDSDAFRPFTDDDFSHERAKKTVQYYDVINKTVELLCAEKDIKTSIIGRATNNRSGYYKSMFIDDFCIELDYDRNLWKNTSKIATPFWVGICNHDWEQTDEMLQVMRHIESEYKDDETYDWIFLALKPLTNATLEEMGIDLKNQILEYIKKFG